MRSGLFERPHLPRRQIVDPSHDSNPQAIAKLSYRGAHVSFNRFAKTCPPRKRPGRPADVLNDCKMITRVLPLQPYRAAIRMTEDNHKAAPQPECNLKRGHHLRSNDMPGEAHRVQAPRRACEDRLRHHSLVDTGEDRCGRPTRHPPIHGRAALSPEHPQDRRIPGRKQRGGSPFENGFVHLHTNRGVDRPGAVRQKCRFRRKYDAGDLRLPRTSFVLLLDNDDEAGVHDRSESCRQSTGVLRTLS
jgi:hypothetical protein